MNSPLGEKTTSRIGGPSMPSIGVASKSASERSSRRPSAAPIAIRVPSGDTATDPMLSGASTWTRAMGMAGGWLRPPPSAHTSHAPAATPATAGQARRQKGATGGTATAPAD